MMEDPKETFNEQAQRQKRFFWDGPLPKIIFLISTFFVVIFTVLGNIGGNSDFYKESLEQYIQGATGYNARIEKLNSLRFFPSVIFDFEDLKLFKTPEDQAPIASLGLFQVRVGFWDAMTRSGKFKAIEIRDFNAMPGAFTNQSLRLDTVTIAQNHLEVSENPMLEIKGKLGEKDLRASVMLKDTGIAQRKSFRISGDGGFKIELGDIRLKGLMSQGVFNDVVLTSGAEEILRGKFTIMRKTTNEIGIQGDLIFLENKSRVLPDLILSSAENQKIKLNGTIRSTDFYAQDFFPTSHFIKFVKNFEDIIGSNFSHVPLDSINLDLNFNRFVVKGLDLGVLNLKATREGKVFRVSGDQEKTKVNISIEPIMQAHIIDTDIKLADVQFGRTRADVFFQLKGDLSRPETYDGNLYAVFAGGFVPAVILSLIKQEKFSSPQIQCGVVDFEIETERARSRALFLKADQFTLAGEGSYDISQDIADVNTRIKLKDKNVGDIRSGVALKGPINRLESFEDMRGMTREISGPLLGSVNPMNLSFQLEDLSPEVSIACAPYIKAEQEILEVPAIGRSF